MDSQTSTPATQNNISFVPKTWPGAFGVFKYSKKAVMLNALGFILIFVINLAFGLWIRKSDSLLLALVANLFTIFLGLSFVILSLASTRGQKQSIDEAFKLAAEPLLLIKFFVTYLVAYFAIAVGFLLLIVPGIFILPRLIFAPYYLVDRKLGIDGALTASWENGGDHLGKVWGIIGVMLLMGLLMVTIIGIPVASYLLFVYSAAFAVLYRFVNEQTKTAVQANPEVPAKTPAV